MNVSLRLPFGVSPASVSQLVRLAADARLAPAPGVSGLPKPTWLNPQALRALVDGGYELDAPTLEGLLVAGRELDLANSHSALAKGNPPSTADVDDRQAKQDEAVNWLTERIASGQIALWELSTGFGKSRVLGRIAARVANEPESRTYVVEPTISAMAHLLHEFDNVAPDLAPAFLLGAQNFVSRKRIEAVILEVLEFEEGEQIVAPVREWLAQGGPVKQPHTRLFAKLEPTAAYFADDLLAVSPDFPIEECRLEPGEEGEPATECLRALAERAKEAPVVICTMTMLALREVLRPGDAAPITLLVDEAHSLEDALASVLSPTLSLFTLRAWLKQEPFKGARKFVEPISHFLQRMRHELKQQQLDYHDPAFVELRNLLRPIHSAVSKVRRESLSSEGQRLRYTMGRVIDDRLEGLPAYVLFSSRLRYVRFVFGPTSIRKPLQRLWEHCEGVALVSGTLALPKRDGHTDYSYITRILHLPPARLVTRDPLVMPWLHTTPVLHLPEAKNWERLSYPGAATEPGSPHTYEKWIASVAAALEEIWGNAKGGTLVLLNSHADREALATALGQNQTGLLDGTGSVTAMASRFRALYSDGKKPLWLALGPAWTGLDLRAEGPPGNDFLLTDLVIVRMPINASQTATFLYRSQQSFTARIDEALFRLRQGLGRLVRRGGLSHRKIHFLDGRPWMPSVQWGSRVQALLRQYPQQ